MPAPRVVLLAMALAACGSSPPSPAPEYALTRAERVPFAEQNEAYRWLDVTQEACARDVERIGARPTVLSHQMMIWAVAMFDAWAAYDERAVGSRFGGELRRPAAERTDANKRTAIAYASYRALCGVLPEHVEYLRERMVAFGFDPDDHSVDTATPQGIGNVVAQAVLDYRAHDGSNRLGDEAGGDGTPYSDYTGYQPINPVDRIVDPDRWQPITFTRPDGTKFTPGYLTPQWGMVKPFVLESPAQFRAEPPPTTRTDDAKLREQTDLVLRYNAELTDEQKAIVEFMRDGPRSTGQSGHWLRFAQDVSRRDHNDLDADVKLYFAIAVTAFDAFVSCWETKRFYDTSRPWTLVRHYYAGQKVKGWAGPQGGVVEMPAEEWHPYSPYVFVTPPFPGYTSGHATVSGACAKVLELFTGSDWYGATEVRPCCVLTEQRSPTEARLVLPTFSSTSALAAQSRALGGYHIPIDNDVGLRIGREIAAWSWPHIRAYWDGTAKVRD
ncbi:MAG: vanadium-dependent haloperoxidase [Planctomycetota bacterium]